jgi:hypothetical protein
METDTQAELQPNVQEILDELNRTQDGKVQLELAALRVMVAKQQAYIAEQNGSDVANDPASS